MQYRASRRATGAERSSRCAVRTSVAVAVLSAVLAAAPIGTASAQTGGSIGFVAPDNVQVGGDNNSVLNPFVQPQDSAQSGGGINQSLQFGDILSGSLQDDLQIGLLGVDVFFGEEGDDVQIGGPEHFNPQNRDRAFSGPGHDIFIWAPGDGSDFLSGALGIDALIFGLIGEVGADGQPVFAVSNNRQAGEVFLDPETNLPAVDVSGSPGFCAVIDDSSSPEAADELDALGIDRLVQFFVRSEADDGAVDGDNGLRVTLHVRGVEVLACASRTGGAIEYLDLTQSPPALIGLGDIRPRKLRARLRAIVF